MTHRSTPKHSNSTGTSPSSDDTRFILERSELSPDDIAAMRAICAGCPLTALCGAYGDAARPPAGMWAGRLYNNATKG